MVVDIRKPGGMEQPVDTQRRRDLWEEELEGQYIVTAATCQGRRYILCPVMAKTAEKSRGKHRDGAVLHLLSARKSPIQLLLSFSDVLSCRVPIATLPLILTIL